MQPENADEPIAVTVPPSVTDNKGVLSLNALFGITVFPVELIFRVVFPPVVPNALLAKLRPNIAVKPVGKLRTKLLLQPENAFAPTVVKDVLLIVTAANLVHPENADEPIVPILPPSVTDIKEVLFKNVLIGIVVIGPPIVKAVFVLVLNIFVAIISVLFAGNSSVNELLHPLNAPGQTVLLESPVTLTVANTEQFLNDPLPIIVKPLLVATKEVNAVQSSNAASFIDVRLFALKEVNALHL